ncbi:MAG: Crp/Fnr family transcriptional regulator [bacterium]|nr:Crp/Fnr family transcriptional regulator [bacterium]MBU1917384.1 Crp/Fnr family transcriptional regulator [bacterium]
MVKQHKYFCDQCDGLSNSLFNHLSPEDLALLDENKTCQVYKKGQIIFHEGNKPMGIYCVQEGSVKIYKTGVDGREQIVRMAKKGDFLGYRTLLGSDVYTAAGAAIVDAVICFIDKQVFFDVVKRNEKMLWLFIELLATELKAAENYIADMAQKTVRERLAEVLLLLKNKYGFHTTERNVLNVTLTRDELASIVGTATETLIRHLSDFKDECVIEVKGRKIKILDLPKLIKIANISL